MTRLLLLRWHLDNLWKGPHRCSHYFFFFNLFDFFSSCTRWCSLGLCLRPRLQKLWLWPFSFFSVTLGYLNWRLRIIVVRVVNVQHYSEAPILCVLPASLTDIWFSINVMPLFDPSDQMCHFLFVTPRPSTLRFDQPPQKVWTTRTLALDALVKILSCNGADGDMSNKNCSTEIATWGENTTADHQKLPKPHTLELTFRRNLEPKYWRCRKIYTCSVRHATQTVFLVDPILGQP